MQSPQDPEITLTHGGLRLVVAPYGASLRGLSRLGPEGAREDIITGYSGAEHKAGGEGDVLIPFPGRVAEGQYTFGGQTYQMDKNDKEVPAAIHGFLRHALWETAHQSADEVTFVIGLATDAHPGYPFALAVRVTYRLSREGLTCSFAMENVGEKAAPVAAGFHPYFTVNSALIDADTLHVPFGSTLEFQDLLPTGRVLPVDLTPLDFRQPHAIGDLKFNHCYLGPQRDPDGLVRIRLSDPATSKSLAVWLDSAFDYVVLYSGDPLPESHRRRALAIEPMTCGSDALNHPQWGLVTLEPGQTLTGAWGVTTEE